MPKNIYEVIKTKPNSNEWLQLRNLGLGGSDIAAIRGMSSWRSPYDVWLEKTGQKPAEDISDKPYIIWGTKLEDIIAQTFAENHPELKVSRVNAILRRRDFPYLQASLDRRITDENGNHGILEIKTANEFAKESWEKSVPEYYLTQVAHYLCVTGWKFVWVAVLIGGSDYREYYFTRDDLNTYIYEGFEAAQKFWNINVLGGVQPAMVGNDAESAALLAKNPLKADADIVPAPKDFDDLVLSYLELKEREAAIKQLVSAASDEIKAVIGTNEGMESTTYTVKWPRSTRRTLDKKKFEQDHPHMLDDYYTTSVVNGALSIKVN